MKNLIVIAAAAFALAGTAALAGHGQVAEAAKTGAAEGKNQSSNAAGGWSTVVNNASGGTAAENAGK